MTGVVGVLSYLCVSLHLKNRHFLKIVSTDRIRLTLNDIPEFLDQPGHSRGLPGLLGDMQKYINLPDLDSLGFQPLEIQNPH